MKMLEFLNWWISSLYQLWDLWLSVIKLQIVQNCSLNDRLTELQNISVLDKLNDLPIDLLQFTRWATQSLSLTHPLTHSLTHSLTQSPTNSLTQSLIHSLHATKFASEFNIPLFNLWKTNNNLNYTSSFNSYRAVNTYQHGFKMWSVLYRETITSFLVSIQNKWIPSVSRM